MLIWHKISSIRICILGYLMLGYMYAMLYELVGIVFTHMQLIEVIKAFQFLNLKKRFTKRLYAHSKSYSNIHTQG